MKSNFQAHPIGIYLHIFASLIALAIGPFQFHEKFRLNKIQVHRMLGKIYLISVLIGGLSGLYMSQYSFGGMISHSGFFTLAILWLATGYKAYHSIKNKIPFVMISKSGGARMMEAAYSLMQLAKTSAKLAQLAEAGIPYISLCTDPTTGGTTASYAMLGDINISEPGALIGFAGPRVVRDTTGKDLPEGFQTAEFLLEHGFLDFITPRKELKDKINLYIDLILNQEVR
jgi:acetyl-CoA carboxylase carboxyl transferase subunit beta